MDGSSLTSPPGQPVTSIGWSMSDHRNFLSSNGPSQNLQWANRLDHQSSASPDPPSTGRTHDRVVAWRVLDLKPHSAYAQLGIKIPASRLNELIELGDDAFLFPLIITSTGIVIDGYARIEVARLQGRETLECVEYHISEEEALRRLVLCHRHIRGLPAFCRIMLARPLAKSLKEKALQHQKDGGKSKGSSKLADAQKIDVRKRIGVIAGVSVGTASHASDVLKAGAPEILRALCNGEIKIDRAWRWCKESRSHQSDNLKLYRRHRGMERVTEKLIARQVKKLKPKRRPASRWEGATLSETLCRLGSLTPEVLRSVDVIFIKAPASILALSEDIAQRAGFREETSSCN